MAGFEPQLSVFFGSGIATSGVAVHTLKTGRYEEFDLFRRREVAFWAVAVSVGAYIAAVSLQFP